MRLFRSCAWPWRACGSCVDLSFSRAPRPISRWWRDARPGSWGFVCIAIFPVWLPLARLESPRRKCRIGLIHRWPRIWGRRWVCRCGRGVVSGYYGKVANESMLIRVVFLSRWAWNDYANESFLFRLAGVLVHLQVARKCQCWLSAFGRCELLIIILKNIRFIGRNPASEPLLSAHYDVLVMLMGWLGR